MHTPANNKQQDRTYCISSFAHRFLLQRLQARALHLTPQEKSSLLGELCNKIKHGSNPQPSQLSVTDGYHSGGIPSGTRGRKGHDLSLCGTQWVQTDFATSTQTTEKPGEGQQS